MRVLPILVLLALLGGSAGAAGAAEGDPVPLTDDLSLHEGHGCEQFALDVTALSNGTFAAGWVESSTGLFVRLFDAEGSPAGPRVLVGDSPWNGPTVLASLEGGFRLVWETREALMTRAFSASGAPLGPEARLTVLPRGNDPRTAAAALGDGGFAVAVAGDGLTLWRYTADGQPAGSLVLEPATGQTGVAPRAAPAIAPLGRSGVVVAWNEERGGETFFEGRIVDFAAGSATPFEAGPIPFLERPWPWDEPPRPQVASSAAGTIMVAWLHSSLLDREIVAQVFGGDGIPLGEPFAIDPAQPAAEIEPELVSDSAGNFLVSWIGHEMHLRRVSPHGVPLGTTQPATARTYSNGLFIPPVLAITSADRLLVAWELFDPNSFQCHTKGLFARLYDASTGALPLQGGRFRVSVRWTDHQGDTGEGTPVALTADSGYFWFFGPDNLELMVKVLDGRAVNGRFWFSYAALSDVAYTITVTDTVTGITKDFTNPAGQLASHGDTSTFVDSATSATAASHPQAFAAAPQLLVATTAAGPCAAEDQPRRPGLCLGGRFEAEVVWRTPSLGDDSAQGVPLTPDSGYFWFFGANNIELVVKVLDGRPVNGRFWVFFGSLTDVDYSLTVRDTATGAERVYFNPPGQFHSRADTVAF